MSSPVGEELRLRVREKAGMSVQVMTLPAVTCIMRRYLGCASQEKYNAMYALYHECIRKGYILSDDPLFTISDRKDFLEGYIGKDPFSIDVCVPLRADKAPAEAVVLPECRALSVLYYGEYSGMDEAWLTLGREVKARGLKPIGPPRVLGIVAPYTGREINAQRYCSRLVLPVEEE